MKDLDKNFANYVLFQKMVYDSQKQFLQTPNSSGKFMDLIVTKYFLWQKYKMRVDMEQAPSL